MKYIGIATYKQGHDFYPAGTEMHRTHKCASPEIAMERIKKSYFVKLGHCEFDLRVIEIA